MYVCIYAHLHAPARAPAQRRVALTLRSVCAAVAAAHVVTSSSMDKPRGFYQPTVTSKSRIRSNSRPLARISLDDKNISVLPSFFPRLFCTSRFFLLSPLYGRESMSHARRVTNGRVFRDLIKSLVRATATSRFRPRNESNLASDRH